jgi:hypothetical protein
VKKVFFKAVAILLPLICATPGAEILQITKPQFPPSATAEFGLHRLPAASPHADLVAFSSHSAALVNEDTNNLPDIFLWSRASGEVRSFTRTANGASFDPALSKDGRFIAFVSSASNLVPGDTNKLEDVFLANAVTGAIELVSVRLQNAPGRLSTTRYATISEDGRYVAFAAGRADLLPTGTSTRDHVLIRDRVAGETVWATSTLEASAVTVRPLAIREGRLWFLSSTNLYQFDLTSRALKSFGKTSVEPAFNSDGSRVALQLLTQRTNIVSWYDSATGETNVVYTGSTNRVRPYDSLSIADTGAIGFVAAHEDTNRLSDVFVAVPGGDPTAPIWVSSIPTPDDATVAASAPLISPDGKRVYFKLTTISKIDGTRLIQIYVRDLNAADPEVIVTGYYFSKFIRTPAGALVIGGPEDFGFATPSDSTDLALLQDATPRPPEASLRIARAAEGWRISFEKIPNTAPKVQSTDILAPGAWSDTSLQLQDGGAEWFVIDPTSADQRFYRLLVTP